MGLKLASVSYAQVIEHVDALIAIGEPAYFITANLNYCMLSANEPALRAINRAAAFILADGMPLVWASRLLGTPLPGRVTGADLTPALCAHAAERGHNVFILGAEPDVAQQAVERLVEKHPQLRVVGVESPDLASIGREEHAALLDRIRAAQPHLVLVAFGQPKGELWIAENYRSLGPAVYVQVGASVAFAAGRAQRAPKWLQRAGLEWFYRLSREPVRLSRRYACNFLFMLRLAVAQLWAGLVARRRR